MKVLILGSTGMLGQSLMSLFKKQASIVHGVARANADFDLDIVQNLDKLKVIIEQNQYDVVINTVALINLAYCEQHPEKAYMVNTYIPGEISKLCEQLNIYFVQISTDHYYTGDNRQLHSESDEVVLLNEYAKTKYLAEKLVEIYPNTLIVRTNIVGFRNSNEPTFVEWILNALNQNESLTGYTNIYTSSIDVSSFSKILYILIVKKQTGLMNVSAVGVMSKYEFIYSLAEKFGKGYLVERGLLLNGHVQRCDSLGLSLKKLKQQLPELTIPTVNEVVDNLYEEYISNFEER